MGGKNGPEGGNRIVLASQLRLQTVMEQSPGAEPFGLSLQMLSPKQTST
jgi:hypothetical protein